MKKQQLQQLTAHDKVLIFENFHYLLEALEEYVEKTGYYPDFRNKRQLRNATVKDQLSLNQAESLFRTRLLIFAGMDTPNFLSEEIKTELYRWINIVGIDPNNCPEKLKHFLLETNNVIEGNDDKIIKQTQENLESKKNDPSFQSMDNVVKVFGHIQKPLDEKREQAKTFEGKSHREVGFETRFGSGSVEKGQRAFDQIASTASNSGNFHFFSQQGQQLPSNIVEQYELAKAKLRGEVPLEGRETREGLVQWVTELERSQQQAQQVQQQPPYSWR